MRLIFTALLASSWAVGAFAAGEGFQPAVNYPTGPTPLAVAAGDFNGDGKPDLAVANYGASNVSLLRGNGDGTFQSAADFAVSSNPRSVIVSDFNNDGRLDLVTANLSDNTVSVLLGNGDGTFKPKADYAVGTSPYQAAVGDFNGDGGADLMVLNRVSNNVGVMLGKGDGTFNAAVNYSLTQAGIALALGDFNRDGKPDVASSNYDPEGSAETAIGVLLNIPQSYTISGRITNAADPFDNGLKDVTVTLSGSQNATALTDVNGNYSFSIQSAGGNYTVTPALADYNFTPASQTFNNLGGNKVADFKAARKTTLQFSSASYVDGIIGVAGVSLPQRDQLVGQLQSNQITRAQALRTIMESGEVARRFFNQGFVVMQYFGYLKRDPDGLYVEWIKELDRTGDYRTLVNGFMNSVEYRQRFGQ